MAAGWCVRGMIVLSPPLAVWTLGSSDPKELCWCPLASGLSGIARYRRGRATLGSWERACKLLRRLLKLSMLTEACSDSDKQTDLFFPLSRSGRILGTGARMKEKDHSSRFVFFLFGWVAFLSFLSECGVGFYPFRPSFPS